MYTNHQPLQYLQSQTKLHQSLHFRSMGFIQKIHLVIKYKKGINNKVANMLSRPKINTLIIFQNSPMAHDSYIE